MKVYFDTLGCAKNFGDSEMAMGMLEQHGHEVVTDPTEADAIVVNTCPSARYSIWPGSVRRERN